MPKNTFALLNKVESSAVFGRFWDEVRQRATTERGEKPDLRAPWIRDYCEIIGDMSRSTVIVQGCSQVGKSYFNFLNANYQASLGYRVLVVLPTQEALLRNQKNQIAPISRSWAILEPLGTQIWKGRGKGAIIFGYASTSGSGPSKSRDRLAVTGGSASAVSCDILIADEVSQTSPESLSPFERRLDAGCLDARPTRYLGTAGAGGGIERLTSGIPNIYPQCLCPHCSRPFPLDPYQCLFKTTLSSGWIDSWYEDSLGNATVTCIHCATPIQEPLLTTRISSGLGESIALHLTPLLRRGTPCADLRRSMLSSQRNGSGSQDWLQQALGVPSELRGYMSLAPKDLVAKNIPVNPQNFKGLFFGIDQGIGSHYGAKISVFTTDTGLPIIKVVAIEAGGSSMIRSLSNGCKLGLIDTMPDRTLALQLSEECRNLTLARQKYNLGYVNLEGSATIGDFAHQCVELPINAHLQIMEAALDGRLSFDCDITDQAKKHLTSPSFDRNGYKLIRPQNHEDDLYFALYFAVSAYLAQIA